MTKVIRRRPTNNLSVSIHPPRALPSRPSYPPPSHSWWTDKRGPAKTSKESAYVQATRARNGTDWHIARDQLGQEGQDPNRITRLAERMSQSQEHTPSIAYQETPDPAWDPTRDPLRTDEMTPHMDWLNREQERDTRHVGLER